MPETLLELEQLRRDDEHLDVGHVVGDAPRDASRQHDLFDNRWKRGGDPLCERAQLPVRSVAIDRI